MTLTFFQTIAFTLWAGSTLPTIRALWNGSTLEWGDGCPYHRCLVADLRAGLPLSITFSIVLVEMTGQCVWQRRKGSTREEMYGNLFRRCNLEGKTEY